MTDRALSPLIDQPDARKPSSSFGLTPWRRPAILAPFVDAVFAARKFFTHGTNDVPTSEEPIDMPGTKAPKKTLPTSREATPARARLEAAARKAAAAKAKARDAKAALKKSKKAFRLARKAAKAARKEVETLQAAITRAEERAAAAAKRARATRRAPDTDPATASPTLPVAPKPRKVRRAAASTQPGPDVVYTDPLATPSGSAEGSSSPTAS